MWELLGDGFTITTSQKKTRRIAIAKINTFSILWEHFSRIAILFFSSFYAIFVNDNSRFTKNMINKIDFPGEIPLLLLF